MHIITIYHYFLFYLAIGPSPHEKIPMKEFNSSYPENNQENIQGSTACNDSKPVFKFGVFRKLFHKPCRKLYCI